MLTIRDVLGIILSKRLDPPSRTYTKNTVASPWSKAAALIVE
ncbi:hypothetical protein Hanom_Chr03g00263211 [Helianthus anomalus]